MAWCRAVGCWWHGWPNPRSWHRSPAALPSPRRLQEAAAAAKAAAKAAAGIPAHGTKKAAATAGGAAEEELDPTQYFSNRCDAVDALATHNVNPYPHKFAATTSVPEFIDKYSGIAVDTTVFTDVVAVAGRLLLLRSSSSKLQFYTLSADGAKIQIMMNFEVRVRSPRLGCLRFPAGMVTRAPPLGPSAIRACVGARVCVACGVRVCGALPPRCCLHSACPLLMPLPRPRPRHRHRHRHRPCPRPQFYTDKAEYEVVHHTLRRGDIVGVVGHPAKSKKGELSIVPTHVELLSPCLHMLPKVPRPRVTAHAPTYPRTRTPSSRRVPPSAG